jgi:anti-sigma B factor antagonist
MMKYQETKIGNAFVVKVLESRITADVSSRFKADMMDFVKAGQHKIVLDLSDVTFIDSSGLGALIAILKVIGKDGEIVIAAAPATVAVMFELTRMDRVFRLIKTVDEAVSSFS